MQPANTTAHSALGNLEYQRYASNRFHQYTVNQVSRFWQANLPPVIQHSFKQNKEYATQTLTASPCDEQP